MSPPTVWVVLHDLSRSGVPIVLERLLAWLPADERSHVHVVALHDGPMRAPISRLGATVVALSPATGRSFTSAWPAMLRQAGCDAVATRTEARLARLAVRHLPDPDVVVLHGAGASPALDWVPTGVPVVLHLHELHVALERSVPARLRAGLPDRAARVMVVSEPVRSLAEQLGVPSARIELVPGVVGDGPTPDVAAARGRLGGGRWVLGAGQASWRKGTDRMAGIAWELARTVPEARVGWVGRPPTGGDAIWTDAEDPVTWFGEHADPWELLAGAQVLVVPSREDPLPLVALEAGRAGVPVVATATGGLSDLLDHGRGLIAGTPTMAGLCTAVADVLASPQRAAALGDALAEHVERHHVARVVAPRWWGTVCEVAEHG